MILKSHKEPVEEDRYYNVVFSTSHYFDLTNRKVTKGNNTFIYIIMSNLQMTHSVSDQTIRYEACSHPGLTASSGTLMHVWPGTWMRDSSKSLRLRASITIIVIVWSSIMWKSFSAEMPPAGTTAIRQKINLKNLKRTVSNSKHFTGETLTIMEPNLSV